MTNEIYVSNIGCVYRGNDDAKAQIDYDDYVLLSKLEYGRAGGEDVAWFKGNEIYKEFIGALTKQNEME